MKALKVTISGSYSSSGKDIVDFDNVEGIIPFTDEEHAAMHVRSRYANEWVKAEKKKDGEKMYPDRIELMRQVFIDDIEEVEADLSFISTDIKKMSDRELQDLATYKNLMKIPLPKPQSGSSLREMREIAYVEYVDKIMGDYVDPNSPDFNFSKLDAIIINPDAKAAKHETKSIDQSIDDEVSDEDDEDEMTLDELKAIADEKGIVYHHRIGFDKLYAKVYS